DVCSSDLSESYGDRLGKSGLEKLKTWIRDGGTVVTVGDAGKFLREKDADVSKLKAWEPPKKDDKKPDEAKQDERYNEPRVPGAAFRTVINDRSYLTFGVRSEEHTSELQSLAYLVCRLLLEKKK